MRTLKLTLALTVLVAGPALFAQTAQHDALMNDYHYVQGQIRPTNADELGDIQGTPYYHDDFQKSLLYFNDAKAVPAEVRYNVVKEEMQALFDLRNYRVLHDQIVVEMDGKAFQKFSYRADDKGTDLLGYFEVLTEDHKNKDLILLKKPVKEVKEGKKTLRMQMAFPSKYVEKSELYVKFKDKVRAEAVDKNSNKFLAVFPKEHRDEMKKFIKSNSYSTKDEADLAAIVDHYNQNF